MFRLPLISAATMLAAFATASAETKTYKLAGFEGVAASAGVDVEVMIGGDYSVTLETNGDPNEAIVELRGDTLMLSRERTNGIRLGGRNRLSFVVTMPDFSEGRSSAGAELSIEGIDGGRIRLDASSGADLNASGSCDTLDVEASSGADIAASDLECDTVNAKVSSGAGIEAHANDELNARASSGGSVRVNGNPDRRDVKKSSGGSVRFGR